MTRIFTKGNRMMISLKATICIALALAISGCGLARVYNKVTLGEPLPSNLELVEIGPEEAGLSNDEHLFFRIEYDVDHSPRAASHHMVVVWTDADDKVIASVHNKATFTNLHLLIFASHTTTMDIRLPAEAVARPKGMTLSQITPEYSPGASPAGTCEAEEKAVMRTAGFAASYCVGLRSHNTWEYAIDLPLSSLPAPGSHRTIKVHRGGYLTLTNRGNNGLRIETYVSLVTDPAGQMMDAVFYLEQLEEESSEDDE